MSYHINYMHIIYHIIPQPYHIIYQILSYRIISYHIISYHTISYHMMSYPIKIKRISQFHNYYYWESLSSYLVPPGNAWKLVRTDHVQFLNFHEFIIHEKFNFSILTLSLNTAQTAYREFFTKICRGIKIFVQILRN